MNIENMTKPAARRPLGTFGGAAPPKYLPFVRAAFAVAQGRGKHDETQRCLKKLGCEVAPYIVNRANAAVATTSDSGWASQLATESFGAFLADLGPYSGASRLIAQAVPTTLGSNVTARYPVRTTAAAAASWVAEGGAIPVRQYAFSEITIGPRKKLASIIVWSNELSQRSDAFKIFERMLREDIAAGLDGALLATTAGSASAHAGLLYGVTPIAGYGGGDDTAMKTDLTALSEAVSSGGSGNITYVMAPERLARLRIIAPELAERLDIATSASVPATRVIAADAAALLVAVDPAPEIFVSKEATLHMSDAAAELVSDAPVVADPIRSTFQTDTVATRIIHQLAFAKRRSTAVAYVDSVTW